MISLCRSFASVACVRFPPRTIAGACLVLAARQAGEALPSSRAWAERRFDTTEAILDGASCGATSLMSSADDGA